MKKTVRLGVLENGEPLVLHLDKFVHGAISASSGGGKSTLIRLILERTYGITPQMILDLEGDFGTLREIGDYVLVGENGDMRPNLAAAKLLPRRVLEANFSTVVDMSDMPIKDRHQYAHDSLHGLMDLPRELWQYLLIVIDEGHHFAPEEEKKGQTSIAKEEVVDVQSRGRKRDYHMIIASQRFSKVDKNAVSEANMRMFGYQNLSDDRTRAIRELGLMSEKAHWDKVLMALKPGEFLVTGRAFGLTGVHKALIDMPKTKPPPRGKKAPSSPAPRARVNEILKQLQDLPQQANEEARNLAEANKRIKDLNRDLAAARKQNPPPIAPPKVETKIETKVERVEVPVLKPKQAEALERSIDKAMKHGERLIEHGQSIVEDGQAWQAGAKELAASLAASTAQAQAIAEAAARPAPAAAAKPMVVRPTRQVEHPTNGTAVGTEAVTSELPKGERATLTACIQFPNGLEREQLTVLTGYKRSSRDAYIQRLRERGLLEVRGTRVMATEAGVKAVPDAQPLPTGKELQSYWLTRLPEGERKVLEVLIKAHPAPVEREYIDESTGYKRSSRDAYVQRLKSKELVVLDGRGLVRASDNLFEVHSA